MTRNEQRLVGTKICYRVIMRSQKSSFTGRYWEGKLKQPILTRATGIDLNWEKMTVNIKDAAREAIAVREINSN